MEEGEPLTKLGSTITYELSRMWRTKEFITFLSKNLKEFFMLLEKEVKWTFLILNKELSKIVFCCWKGRYDGRKSCEQGLVKSLPIHFRKKITNANKLVHKVFLEYKYQEWVSGLALRTAL